MNTIPARTHSFCLSRLPFVPTELYTFVRVRSYLALFLITRNLLKVTQEQIDFKTVDVKSFTCHRLSNLIDHWVTAITLSITTNHRASVQFIEKGQRTCRFYLKKAEKAICLLRNTDKLVNKIGAHLVFFKAIFQYVYRCIKNPSDEYWKRHGNRTFVTIW